MAPSDIKHYRITEPWLSLNMGLGEAPYYHKETNTLRFVDIVKQKLYQVDLTKGPESLKTFSLDISVGTTAELDGGDGKEFIFGGKGGYGLMDRETGKWRYLVKYWDGKAEGEREELTKRFRGNDGAVDARGRYFVGVMNDPSVEEIKNQGEPGFIHVRICFLCQVTICYRCCEVVVAVTEVVVTPANSVGCFFFGG